MQKCDHCGSSDVSWFSPERCARRGAVVLCRQCRHLTVVPLRHRRPTRAHRALLRRAA